MLRAFVAYLASRIGGRGLEPCPSKTNDLEICIFRDLIWHNFNILGQGLICQHQGYVINMLLLVCCCLAIAKLFQLYHGDDMMYDIRRRPPDPTVLLTQGMFNLPHHITYYERNWPLMML